MSHIRPLTIVNVMLKWISGVLYLHLENVISHMGPPEQASFTKGREHPSLQDILGEHTDRIPTEH